MHVCGYVYLSMYEFVCMFVCMYVCLCVFVFVCIGLCVCVCVAIHSSALKMKEKKKSSEFPASSYKRPSADHYSDLKRGATL